MGRRTQTTSAAGRVQSTTYDKAGRVTEVRQPGESQGTRTEYDAAGRPTKTTSPGGLVTQTSYDSQGRVTKSTDPAGNVITYEYGAAGDPLAGLLIATNYPTYRETYQYDQRGQQTVVTQYLSDTQTIVKRQNYDANGQQIAAIDPAGKTTLYTYDVLGHLIQTTDPIAQATKQARDAQDNLISLTDAKGNQHKFEYDKLNRLTREIRPMGGAIVYAYNVGNQLIQRTDAGGNTKTYTYDAAGRLISEAHKLSGSTLDQQISYSYDPDGQLTGYEQKDGNGQIISSASYSLDAQGRTTQGSITYGKISTGSFSFQIGQSFNADGQLDGHTYPDGSQQSYSYTNGRLSKVTLPNGSEINYSNYNWMMPGQITTPGATKSVSYDALQRPTSIQVKNQQAQILANRLYQYDQAGNITQINSDLGQTTYKYDQLDRLTQAQPDNDLQNRGLPLETYYYDPVGNRTASGHQPGMWSYNQDNQLIQYPKLTPFSTGASPIDTQVSYTPQGHASKETNSQGEQAYSYNAAERLISYANTPQSQSTPSLQADYRYDPFGRRIVKSVTENGTTTTTYFIYSDGGLMAEVNEQGQITKAYGFNPIAAQQGLWSTDPIWQANVQNNSLMDAATNFHYLYTDHLGTPILATTNEGVVSWKAVIEAFGAASILPETNIVLNFRFPGQYYDQETGAHYNFHRDYKPNIGRYIQSDPLGMSAGSNTYEYAYENSINFYDSEGFQANGGWAPLPGPPSGNVNTIYCANGNLDLYIIPVPSCPAIEACIRVHEDTHRKDALKFNPIICNGLNGVGVGYYGAEFRRDAEIRAFSNELACLIKSKQRCDMNCNKEIEDRIYNISHVYMIKVLNGTYWNDYH
jgi:RHS repeat-associated protein